MTQTAKSYIFRQTVSPLTIRKSVEFCALLDAVLALNPDIKRGERGWFPRLMIRVLREYIALKAVKNVKVKQ
jgi:hypothetical protein